MSMFGDILGDAYEEGLKEGAAKERAAIVAWLRDESRNGISANASKILANYIESGKHLEGKQ